MLEIKYDTPTYFARLYLLEKDDYMLYIESSENTILERAYYNESGYGGVIDELPDTYTEFVLFLAPNTPNGTAVELDINVVVSSTFNLVMPIILMVFAIANMAWIIYRF